MALGLQVKLLVASVALLGAFWFGYSYASNKAEAKVKKEFQEQNAVLVATVRAERLRGNRLVSEEAERAKEYFRQMRVLQDRFNVLQEDTLDANLGARDANECPAPLSSPDFHRLLERALAPPTNP